MAAFFCARTRERNVDLLPERSQFKTQGTVCFSIIFAQPGLHSRLSFWSGLNPPAPMLQQDYPPRDRGADRPAEHFLDRVPNARVAIGRRILIRFAASSKVNFGSYNALTEH
jgi:hypothetical protein